MGKKNYQGRRRSPQMTITLPDDMFDFLDNQLGVRYLPELGKQKRSGKIAFCIKKVKEACERGQDN